jgi:hypothetical protein
VRERLLNATNQTKTDKTQTLSIHHYLYKYKLNNSHYDLGDLPRSLERKGHSRSLTNYIRCATIQLRSSVQVDDGHSALKAIHRWVCASTWRSSSSLGISDSLWNRSIHPSICTADSATFIYLFVWAVTHVW